MSLPRHTKIAVALFFLGLFCANLISVHVHPFRTFYNELAAVLGLLLGAIFLFRSTAFLAWPKLILLPLSILGMMMLQLLAQKVYAYQIIFPAMYMGLSVLAICFGVAFSVDRDQAKLFCFGLSWAHIITALLSVLMVIIQVCGLDLRPFVMYMAIDGVTAVRPYANIAQPNQLALMFCLGLAGLWWLRQQEKMGGAMAMFCSLLMIWGLALTQSRIAWVILPLFVVLSATAWIGSKRENIWSLSVLLMLYLLIVFNLPDISHWMGFSSGSVIERSGGRSERTVLAQQAIAMATSHPWFGVGWFGFGPAQVEIGADFSPTIYAEHSHNLILNFAAELGLPFAILFFGTFLAWLVRTCLVGDMRTRPEVGLFILFFVAIGVHSLVEFPLWYAFILIPFSALAGLVHGLRWHRWHTSLIPGKSIMRGALVGLILLFVVVFSFQGVVEGFYEFRNGKNLALMDKSKVNRPPFTLMPDFYDYFLLMRMMPASGMSKDDIQFMEQTSHRFAYVHILSRLAEVYTLNDREADAVHMMKTLHRLHPFYYPEYYDYWRSLSAQDVRYLKVFRSMPEKELSN